MTKVGRLVLVCAAGLAGSVETAHAQLPSSEEMQRRINAAASGQQNAATTRSLGPSRDIMSNDGERNGATSIYDPPRDAATPVASNLGVSLFAAPIPFRSGTAQLDLAAARDLLTIAKLLGAVQNRDRHFIIVGHTDAVGNQLRNQELSLRRADAVKAFLIRNGVSAGVIARTEGRGSSEPLDRTSGPSEINRRVEFKIMP